MTKLVVDIAYGDAGKGAVVDRLCAQGDKSVVVRFNGGCQAQHNVITDDGRHHTFSQFGAGTLQGVPTYLSKFMLVEPLSLMVEAHGLKKVGVSSPMEMITIDPDALITTPYHWLVNRWREDQRGDARHGSTGRGVGATAEYALLAEDDALIAQDLGNRDKTMFKLRLLRVWAADQTDGRVALPSAAHVYGKYEEFLGAAKCWHRPLSEYAELGEVVFEGAQGVMLDEHVGFHPYTTWSTVTPGNARALAAESGIDAPTVIGVTRAYTTRHGAGPFVPEDNSLRLPEVHNQMEHYQGAWRVGHLDVPALKYAIDACDGVDFMYITHVDMAMAEPRLKVCTSYRDTELLRLANTDLVAREAQTLALLEDTPILEDRPYDSWVKSIDALLGVPVIGAGVGPMTKDAVAFQYDKSGAPY